MLRAIASVLSKTKARCALGIAAFVRGRDRLAHVAQIDLPGVDGRELGNHGASPWAHLGRTGPRGREASNSSGQLVVVTSGQSIVFTSGQSIVVTSRQPIVVTSGQCIVSTSRQATQAAGSA